MELNWLGAAQPTLYTKRHQRWRYLEPQSLPDPDRSFNHLCNRPIPLNFTLEDCRWIGNIMRDCALAAQGSPVLNALDVPAQEIVAGGLDAPGAGMSATSGISNGEMWCRMG